MEDIIAAAEDAICSIKIALSELDDIPCFEEARGMLEEAIHEIENFVAPYEERYKEECNKENRITIDYTRSVI